MARRPARRRRADAGRSSSSRGPGTCAIAVARTSADAAGGRGDEQRGPGDLLELVRRAGEADAEQEHGLGDEHAADGPPDAGLAVDERRRTRARAGSSRRRRSGPSRSARRRRQAAGPPGPGSPSGMPPSGGQRTARPTARPSPATPAAVASSASAGQPSGENWRGPPRAAQRISAAASSAATIRTPRIGGGRQRIGEERRRDEGHGEADRRRGGLAGRHRDDGAGPDREDDRDQGEAHGLAVAVGGWGSAEGSRRAELGVGQLGQDAERVERPVPEPGTPDHVADLDRPEAPRVGGVLAVVAHDQQLVLGHEPLARAAADRIGGLGQRRPRRRCTARRAPCR